MANLRVVLDDPLVLGQTVQTRARGSGKVLALVSLLLVGAVVGVALRFGGLGGHQDPNVEDSAITMPIVKMPTRFSQSQLRLPMTTQVKPNGAQMTPGPTTCPVIPGGISSSLTSCLQQQPHHSGVCLQAAAAASSQYVYSGGVLASSVALAPVTKEDVIAVQTAWADAIKRISKVYKEKGDYIQTAADAAGELYAYGSSEVLFKPTKAAEYQFRPTPEEAMSYFVGGKAVENGYDEDGGFAINGGRGWSDCVYDNHQVEIKGDVALAMGNYYFTDATSGDKSKVEYTFGYQRCDDGKVRIFLHHSSVPYKVPAATSAGGPVTREEVIAVQTAWADAIKRISKVYKEKGDYIATALDAAGELYAYGHAPVLFKPTKAAKYQFRPTPEEAMSYFVGGAVTDKGYLEDGGFAINGGRGWSDCVYDNHQVELKGDVAFAMGNYYFTDATSGDKSKVEYTFGYERCGDGKVRIFLHHSSVPFKVTGGKTSGGKRRAVKQFFKKIVGKGD